MPTKHMNQDEYIKERLDNQIEWYDGKSVKSQKWFKRLQVIVIIAAAMIPFLSGYMTESTPYLKFVIGALGIVIAAITAILGLYQFQENWLEYRTTCETLRHEKYLFLTGAAPYNAEQPFLLLVERVESLISKENTNWASYMKKAQCKKNR
jgi:hypothetical protein